MTRNIICKYNNSPFRKAAEGLYDYFKNKEQKKIECVLKSFNFNVEKALAQIPWNTFVNFQQESLGNAQSYCLRVKDVCQEGQSPRIQIPDVRRKCEFDTNIENLKTHFEMIDSNKVNFIN